MLSRWSKRTIPRDRKKNCAHHPGDESGWIQSYVLEKESKAGRSVRRVDVGNSVSWIIEWFRLSSMFETSLNQVDSKGQGEKSRGIERLWSPASYVASHQA